MKRLSIWIAAAVIAVSARAQDAVVLIGHASVPRIDSATAQRLYSGRALEVNGQAVTVVNAASPSKARERFMARVMNQDDDKYVAYWTVRKHIGKGTPPREFKSTAELIEFVQGTPGAIGYVLEADLRAGLNIVLRP
jgi:ABC-type phosphate transport system substrate-binding protein